VEQRWENSRRRYDVASGVKTYSDLRGILDFYQCMRGSAYGFRFKDWTDYTTASDGRSARARYDGLLYKGIVGQAAYGIVVPLVKRYQLDLLSSDLIGNTKTSEVVREIHKPVYGTVTIGLKSHADGSETNWYDDFPADDWGVDHTTGLVSLSNVPVGYDVWCGFEFDVPVRFTKAMDDLCSVSLEGYEFGVTDSIELVEILDDSSRVDNYFYGGSKHVLGTTNLPDISHSDGKAILVQSTLGGTCALPNPQFFPTGGPHFFITNVGIGSVNLTDLGQHDDVTGFVLDYDLAVDKSVTIWNTQFQDGSRRWRVWESLEQQT